MKTKLSFVALFCMMLLCAVSCKKNDTPNSNEADFYIDVDFLLNAETNDEVTPRLMANFNDEAVMIELRGPTNETPMESVLILCPEKEAMMLCGNDSLLICAAYDIETRTPSHDMLLVTPIDDNALLLTKCFMDWNTNTMTKHDMMVLPLNDNLKSHGKRGDIVSETRWFFFNRLVKPLAENFEKVENFCGIFGGYGGLVLSYIRTITTTELTMILFSDNPEEFYDAMESTVTMETAQGTLLGISRRIPQVERDLTSRINAAISWAKNFGRGKIFDYFGGSTEGEEEFFKEDFFEVGRITVQAAAQNVPNNLEFAVYLNVSNVTENSAYLKGYIDYGINHILPVEMGYVYKISDGPEHTEEDMGFQGKTLSGLQKATKYTVYAYARSMDTLVKSPAVTFWTLGFEAFPNSLTFPAEGDTKYVALSYSEEDITSWNISSKPSWCTVTKDGDRMFSVEVGQSTETRSGTITITATSNALGSVTQNITVTQNENNWDGTFWVFSGLVQYSGTNVIPGQTYLEISLSINSISNNDFTLSLSNHGIFPNEMLPDLVSGNILIDENGNLKYYGSINANNGSLTLQITFVQTGPATATADFYEHLNIDNGWATSSGLLQGTLIRADEGW